MSFLHEAQQETPEEEDLCPKDQWAKAFKEATEGLEASPEARTALEADGFPFWQEEDVIEQKILLDLQKLRRGNAVPDGSNDLSHRISQAFVRLVCACK